MNSVMRYDCAKDKEAIQRFKDNKPNWWKAVRGMKGKGALSISTAFINGISGMTTNDDARIAEAFKNHYENLAKDETKPHFKEENYTKIRTRGYIVDVSPTSQP